VPNKFNRKNDDKKVSNVPVNFNLQNNDKEIEKRLSQLQATKR
jgi:hypothetical protein